MVGFRVFVCVLICSFMCITFSVFGGLITVYSETAIENNMGGNISTQLAQKTAITSPILDESGERYDDKTYSVVLPFSINFYGINTNLLYVDSNGWVSVGGLSSYPGYNPSAIVSITERLIAPFWIDLSVMNHYTDSSFTWGHPPTVDGTQADLDAVVFSWKNFRPFGLHSPKVTFQIVFRKIGVMGDFDFQFHYSDINFASLSGDLVSIGWASGTGTSGYWVFPYSSANKLLDSDTTNGLIYQSNMTPPEPGGFQFKVRNGRLLIETLAIAPINETISLTETSETFTRAIGPSGVNPNVSWSLNTTAGLSSSTSTDTSQFTVSLIDRNLAPDSVTVRVESTELSSVFDTVTLMIEKQPFTNITISPSNPTRTLSSQSTQFSASILPAVNQDVILWALEGSNASKGSISSSGLFTPTSALISQKTNFTIVAKSQQNPSVKDSVSLDVYPEAFTSIIISPNSPDDMNAIDSLQLSVTTQLDLNNDTVVWSIEGTNSVKGSISQAGLFQPIANSIGGMETFTIKAMSSKDVSIFDSVTVDVYPKDNTIFFGTGF